MANKAKALERYLVQDPGVRKTSLEAYSTCPAEAFLAGVCDAHDAFQHCLNKFTKKLDGDYNKDSADSLREISLALLAAMMGHFETFQKALFAGLVERSSSFPDFSADKFIAHLKKCTDRELVIAPSSLLAFRANKAPVGFVIANSLPGWHSPSLFNLRLKAFGIKKNYFNDKDSSDLDVLWQLRHAIVHTGAWLTEPDSQKVPRLRKFGNRAIAFEPTFLNALARRFHRIVKEGNERLCSDAIALLGTASHQSSASDIKGFLSVRTPKTSWLNGDGVESS